MINCLSIYLSNRHWIVIADISLSDLALVLSLPGMDGRHQDDPEDDGQHGGAHVVSHGTSAHLKDVNCLLFLINRCRNWTATGGYRFWLVEYTIVETLSEKAPRTLWREALRLSQLTTISCQTLVDCQILGCWSSVSIVCIFKQTTFGTHGRCRCLCAEYHILYQTETSPVTFLEQQRKSIAKWTRRAYLAGEGHVEAAHGRDETGHDERQDEGLQHAEEELAGVRHVHDLPIRWVFKDFCNRHSELRHREKRFLGLTSAWKLVFMPA